MSSIPDPEHTQIIPDIYSSYVDELVGIAPPIRCFQCGKVIGNKFHTYFYRTQCLGETKADVLDSMNIKKICCRTNMITYVHVPFAGPPMH
jgi:DNA-directed RNA polymerase subunit N